jgi:UDP-glucose 4-epimerase
MNKILIVGANGYIGSRLCHYFSNQENYEVTALIHSTSIDQKKRKSKFTTIVGDVRDAELIKRLKEIQFSVIINLVSLDHHQSNGDPIRVSNINVIPTWSFLDAFSKSGLEQYIYFSTVQIYGKLTTGSIQEIHPAESVNPYGLTHILSENICEYYNRNSSVACTVLRLSNSYGSPLSLNANCWSLVINQLCKTAFEQKKIKLLSDGTPLRDFIHGVDICQAIKLLIETEKKEYKRDTYNLSSGSTLTIMELAAIVKKVYDRRYNSNLLIEVPSECQMKDIGYYIAKARYSIDNNKLKRVGFEPTVDLDKGINELFSYLEYHNER